MHGNKYGLNLSESFQICWTGWSLEGSLKHLKIIARLADFGPALDLGVQFLHLLEAPVESPEQHVLILAVDVLELVLALRAVLVLLFDHKVF